MRPSFRIGVGFVLGCILSAFAFAMAGIGHGTYTPLAANAPMLICIPEIGVLAALFGTPVLWAAYFFGIPKITPGIARLVTVVLIALVHLGAGAWMAWEDNYLLRTFKSEPRRPLLYFGFLIVSIVMLGVLAALGSKRTLKSKT